MAIVLRGKGLRKYVTDEVGRQTIVSPEDANSPDSDGAENSGNKVCTCG